MTVEAIKAAIQKLPQSDRQNLADWFDELEEQAWDAEMERDFSPGGRGYDLVERINSNIDKGKFGPLDEGSRIRAIS
jgi:hypothetical protein